jgi:hypothetical protein
MNLLVSFRSRNSFQARRTADEFRDQDTGFGTPLRPALTVHPAIAACLTSS